MEAADGSSGPPCIIVEYAIGFLSLDDLLLCAMPVCRLWRACVLDHPTYWRHISLDQYRGRASAGYVELFILRLNRTISRPIHVTTYLDDPRAVLPEIARHLTQIARLEILADVAVAEDVFDALRGAQALLLAHLYLSFHFMHRGPFGRYPTLPLDLFDCYAPALTSLVLFNIELPPLTIPPYLGNLASLGLGCGNGNMSLPLTGRVVRSLALRSITLTIDVGLEDNELLDRATWHSVQELVLHSWHMSRPARGWGVLALPIDRVPRVYLDFCDELGISTLLDSLKGPLCLDLSNDFLNFDARFSTIPSNGLERRVVGHIPRGSPEEETTTILALRSPRITERVHRLEITLDTWERLVASGGYLTSCPLLSELRICIPFSWQSLGTSNGVHRLSCPRLRRLVLGLDRKLHRAPKTLDASIVATFVSTSLSDAPLPISVAVDGFDVVGPLETFTDVLKLTRV